MGVAAIVLEHYPGMTERALLQLENQARQRWSLLAVRIEHRVGRVEVGQPIVLVAAVAEHREPALKACEFLINALKTYAPFWKQEEMEDKTTRWVKPSG